MIDVGAARFVASRLRRDGCLDRPELDFEYRLGLAAALESACEVDRRSWRPVDGGRLLLNERLASVLSGAMGLDRPIEVRWTDLEEEKLGRYCRGARAHEVLIARGLAARLASWTLLHELRHAAQSEATGIGRLREEIGDQALEREACDFANAYHWLALVAPAGEPRA